MTLYCPGCGSTEVTEHVVREAFVAIYHRPNDWELEDYGDVLRVMFYECRSCGQEGEPDEKWTMTPNERLEEERHGRAD